MRKRALSALIMCNLHVCKWENAYSKDLNAWRILMNFYLFIEVKKAGGGGGCTSAWEHIVSLNYRIPWWIFTKLVWDKVLMILHIYIDICAKSAQGLIQGGAKIGYGGGPLLKRTSSSDRKATPTNQMHSNYLEAFGMKSYYFWFHSEVKFLTRFWCLFGLSYFDVF